MSTVSRGLRRRGPMALRRVSPQADGLWAWWPMTEGGGMIVRDVVRGLHGTLNTSVFWGVDGPTDGIASPCMINTNQTGEITLGVCTLPLGSNFTLSLWIKPTSGWDSENNPLFGAFAFGRFYLTAGLSGGNAYSVRGAISNNENCYQSAANIVAHGSWYHLAYVRSGVTAAGNRLYVNGVEMANTLTPTTAVDATATTYYLNANQGAWSTRSRSQDWRLYSRALSPTEVWALYDPRTRGDLYTVPAVRRFAPATGATAYSLPTDPGAYTITGSDALLALGRSMVALSGAYALTGTDAALRTGRVITTDTGAYVLAGSDAALSVTAGLALMADPGAYAVMGTDAAFARGYLAATTTGVYMLTGVDAELLVGGETAQPGHYDLTGFPAGLVYSAALPPYVVREVLTRRMRRSPAIADEDRWIFHHALQIDLETGVGLVSGEGSDPQLMLRWSDDGGQTWSDEHWTSAGRMGEYQTRAVWMRLGRSRDRVYETTVTSPVQWSLLACLLHLERGIH